MSASTSRWGVLLTVAPLPLRASQARAATVSSTFGVDSAAIEASADSPAIFSVAGGVDSCTSWAAGSCINASCGLSASDDICVFKEFDGDASPQQASNVTSPASSAGAPSSTTASQLVISFVQPQTVWNLYHNLGKYPDIRIILSSGIEAGAYRQHYDVNTAIVVFSQPTSGQAVLS